MKTTSSLVLLACLFATAFSQCPIFYVDTNLQGSTFQLCSSNNVPSNYNDKVSSFTVPTGYLVTLYADVGFSGEYWGPYTSGSYNVPASFNDRLSSASVFAAQTSSPPCPVFYTDISLKGNSFQLCSSGNVPAQYVNQISSFLVPPGFSVTLYSGANQTGQSRGPFSANPWDVPADFNDATVYVAITSYQDSDTSDAELNSLPCPVFYVDTNLQGASFQQCNSGNVPTQYNDQVSSFIVPAGFSVQLYPVVNLGGDYWGPYTEGRYNVPSGFNDQLSSVFVAKPGTAPNSGGMYSSYNITNNGYNCPIFYTAYNQTGNSFRLCSSSNAPTQYNDKTYSISIPVGYQVTLYQFSNYGGLSAGPYNAGNYNLPASFVGKLSSVAVTPLLPTFYVDVNLQGGDFQLSSSGNVPANYNDKTSSFTVPNGYSVTLYRDVNYQGPSFGPYTAGTYNVPSNFNDQLSSVVIKKTS